MLQGELSIETNKATMTRWLKAISEGDIATYRDCYTADGTHEVPGTCFFSGVLTADQAAASINLIREVSINGLSMTINSMTAEGNRVSAETKGRCDLNTGEAYDNDYHFIAEMENGKFKKMREYLDTHLVETVFKRAWDAAGMSIPKSFHS